jgi:hypothetical protein
VRADLGDLIMQAAGKLYRRYARWVEADDIRQEMWTWVLGQHPKRIEAVSTWKLRYKLQDAGAAYCRREKAAKSGYSPDDEVFYSLRVLREMIPFVTTDTPMVSRGVDDTKASTGRQAAAGESFGWETTIADLRVAFAALDEAQRETLRAYTAGEDQAPEDVTRALRAMQRRLGGRKPRVDRGVD